jgi:acetate kinase
MSMTAESNILTVNSGSSSIKFALYRMGRDEQVIFSGSLGGIGAGSGVFRVKDGTGKDLLDKTLHTPSHTEALREITAWLKTKTEAEQLDAVGHRLVHGGSRFSKTHLITPEMMETLEELIPYAPDHLPHEIRAIRGFMDAYPEAGEIACFDTAFHRTMPAIARIFALPGDLMRHGVLRYGFHGLSYEYILGELRKEAGQDVAAGRIIMAHLGNGASMAAVKDGRSLDTTMGFSPAGGLVMSTRSGDLDPGVLLYLFKEKGLDVPAVNHMVNKEGGLLGVSGISPDMQELLGEEARDARAARAVELFCYQAKKFLGALAAVLGGLDTLIFTGGIGEKASSIRGRICGNMEFLGILLDQGLNETNSSVISGQDSPVTVRVMKTNEELMIARHTRDILVGSLPSEPQGSQGT